MGEEEGEGAVPAEQHSTSWRGHGHDKKRSKGGNKQTNITRFCTRANWGENWKLACPENFTAFAGGGGVRP